MNTPHTRLGLAFFDFEFKFDYVVFLVVEGNGRRSAFTDIRGRDFLYVCRVNIKLKNNLVERPRKFTIARAVSTKLYFSFVLLRCCDPFSAVKLRFPLLDVHHLPQFLRLSLARFRDFRIT